MHAYLKELNLRTPLMKGRRRNLHGLVVFKVVRDLCVFSSVGVCARAMKAAGQACACVPVRNGPSGSGMQATRVNPRTNLRDYFVQELPACGDQPAYTCRRRVMLPLRSL